MTQPIIFPDPISSLTQISGAALLYFEDPPVMAAPAVVIPSVAEQSLQLMDLIKDRNPPWAPVLYFVFEQGREQAIRALSVVNSLSGVRNAAPRIVYFSYPAGEEPFCNALEAAAQVAGRLADAPAYITPETASNDLLRHILLEAFLEKGRDLSALYEYCEELFTNHSLEHLLLSAYLLRISALGKVTTGPELLLTNPLAAELLAIAIPTGPEAIPTQVTNVIAWEIFRQIISPRLDPLTEDRIELIGEVRNARDAERIALVDRCRDIASKLVDQQGAMNSDKLRGYVQTRVEPEIAALLRLDRKAFRTIADDLFSDKATWGALAGLIAGLTSGSPLLSATGAVTALSSIGAAAFKARVKTRSIIEANDLRLIYFIDRKT